MKAAVDSLRELNLDDRRVEPAPRLLAAAILELADVVELQSEAISALASAQQEATAVAAEREACADIVSRSRTLSEAWEAIRARGGVR